MEISCANAKGGYIKILGDIPARFAFQPRIGSRPRSVTTIYGTYLLRLQPQIYVFRLIVPSPIHEAIQLTN